MFFVEDDSPGQLKRTTTVGESGPDDGVDFLPSEPVQIDISLLSKQLLRFALTTAVFISAFTGVFYHGIVVEHVYEKVGSSKKSEERVETYNTYSGYVMALVEVLVAGYIDRFFPVLEVYVHNALWRLNRHAPTENDPAGRRISRGTHRAIMIIFPLFITLTMGNSLRGLQAGQSSVGFKHIMTVEDLKLEQPVLERIKTAVKSKKGSNATATVLPQGTGRPVTETVLKTAVTQRAAPFTFMTESACGERNDTDPDAKIAGVGQTQRLAINVHDLDKTSVVFGFALNEWNSEALEHELEPTVKFTVSYRDVLGKSATKPKLPSEFSLAEAFEMFVPAKTLFEKAKGDGSRDQYPCVLSDGLKHLDDDIATHKRNHTATNNHTITAPPTSRPPNASTADVSDLFDDEEDEEIDLRFDNSLDGWIEGEDKRYCSGAVTSLFDLANYSDPKFQTLENFMRVVAHGLNKTYGNLSVEDTEITFERYKLSEQIDVQAIRVNMVLEDGIHYMDVPTCPSANDTTCASMYQFDSLMDSFCGATGCAFIDTSGTFNVQREIGMVPYVTNCTIDVENVRYSGDFQGYYPIDCEKQTDAALLYGIGSYISGKEYGGYDRKYGTDAPYIYAPRRHVRFSFAKMSWRTEDIAQRFGAHCGYNKARGHSCDGLWYKLEASGRYLFAGNEAIPQQRLMKADLQAPIPLVQLISPSVYLPKEDVMITMERLNRERFNVTKWDTKQNETLTGELCSMLIDSYLRHIETNNFHLERPMQAMYTSAFYYLMADAAVTAINDTQLAVNSTMSNSTKPLALSKSDMLGNVKLKGDLQIRKISVLIPKSSFFTTLGGLVVVVLLMIVVLVFPRRRVRGVFDENTTDAQKFIVLSSDEDYPSAVHHKSLYFPSSSEQVAFDDLVVERMALLHEETRDQRIYM
ncbi:hypothetical protein ATCC90586_003175 [Pythium insidiosum]|nr:hypothetical protein ATCC90586_003175 [Pythium insidiosum]